MELRPKDCLCQLRTLVIQKAQASQLRICTSLFRATEKLYTGVCRCHKEYMELSGHKRKTWYFRVDGNL